MQDRSIQATVNELVKEKMLLLSGPRQVGKTTLAIKWLNEQGSYLNWDSFQDHKNIRSDGLERKLIEIALRCQPTF